MDERDIWRSARVLLDQYGLDAAIQAAMKADAMLERGDLKGAAVWRRIIEAINALTDTTNPPDASRVH